MTIVLGLDLGSKGGFARYDTKSGELLLGLNRWDKLDPAERVIAFGTWLQAALFGQLFRFDGKESWETMLPDGERVEVVGFEQITFSGEGRGSEFITRQEGVVQYLSRNIAWQGVNVATLKKFALGDRAPKRLILPKDLSKKEKNRAKGERRKLVKGLMVESAREWMEKLGHEPPEKLSEDEADAFLVLAWTLVNALPDWSL